MRRRPGRERGAGIVRSALGLLVLVTACWGSLLLAVPTATGDPVLVSAGPAAGEVVKSPNEVRLTFDRPVPAGLATVRMTTPQGQQVVEGRPQAAADDPNAVTVAMPRTRYGGTYSVAWSLPTSRLEQIGGRTAFHVVTPSRPVAVPHVPTDRDPAVASVHVGLRLVATAALALGVGLAFAIAVTWPEGARSRQLRRLLTVTISGSVVSTLGAVATFGAYAARAPLAEAFDPALVSAGLGSTIGGSLLAGLVVLVPGTIALLQLLTGEPADATRLRWLRGWAVLGCAAAAAATWSFAQPHGPDGPALRTLGGEIALLLAVAVCLGAPVLLGVLLRTAGDSALRTAAPRLAVVMAVGAAALLAIAPVTTAGWPMIALLALGLVVLGTGLVTRRWLRRGADARDRGPAGRTRIRRIAAVATAAVAVTPVAGGAAAAATGGTQLAQPGSQTGEQPPVPAPTGDAEPPR